MSRWITYDYACEGCGEVGPELVEREDVPQELECECGDTKQRIVSMGQFSKMRGLPGRLGDLKTSRQLEKTMKKSKDKSATKEAARELRQLLNTSKGNKDPRSKK